jgi:hypothetical protein
VKVLCGAIQAQNARIYLIDKVLDPASPPEPIVPKNSSGSTTTTTTTTTSAPANAAEVVPGAEAPAG